MNWYSTPIRNLLKPVKAEVAFGEAREEALPEIISLPVMASVEFADDLNTVEVVQDRLTLYAYDNNDEFLQKDGAYVTLIMGTGWLNHPAASYEYSRTIDIKNAPGAVYFRAPGLPHEPKYTWPGNPSVPMEAVHFPMKSPKARAYFWNGWTTIAIPKAEFDQAVFTVSGKYLTGPFAEQEFHWECPLAKLKNTMVISHVFDSGTQISLERSTRSSTLPLPLDCKGVAFETDVLTGYPYGAFSLRAVSRTGKVWYSKPFCRVPALSGETEVINVNNREHGVEAIAVAKEMLPRIHYRFDPNIAGNILTTSAGREFYAHAGHGDHVPTGYQGMISLRGTAPLWMLQSMPRDGSAITSPHWIKEDNGWSLQFTGKGEYICFPCGVTPLTGGYTVDMEVLPEDVSRDQSYFYNSEETPCGMKLDTKDGKFFISYTNKMAVNHYGENVKRFKTNLSPEQGKWNSISLKYDLTRVTLTVNGKSETFPCSGQPRWLAASVFGGNCRQSNGKSMAFQGKLRALSIGP